MVQNTHTSKSVNIAVTTLRLMLLNSKTRMALTNAFCQPGIQGAFIKYSPPSRMIGSGNIESMTRPVGKIFQVPRELGAHPHPRRYNISCHLWTPSSDIDNLTTQHNQLITALCNQGIDIRGQRPKQVYFQSFCN